MGYDLDLLWNIKHWPYLGRNEWSKMNKFFEIVDWVLETIIAALMSLVVTAMLVFIIPAIWVIFSLIVNTISWVVTGTFNIFAGNELFVMAPSLPEWVLRVAVAVLLVIYGFVFKKYYKEITS